MAQTVVDIQVKTSGQQKLERFAKSVSTTDRELSKLNPKLNQTATATKNAGRAAATATGNIQRMGVAFRTTVAPIVAAYGALNFFGRAVGVAGDREKDIALLANGLKRLGAGAAELEKLQKQANDFGNATLFNQEDFIQGAGVLTSFTSVAVSEYQRLIKVAGDLAQTNNTDVRSSLLQVAKAVNAPVEGITALTRSGVQFTNEQKEIVKALVATGQQAKAQELILRELENQYKGNATAAAKGLAGAQDSLGEAFRDFQEVLGTGLSPILEKIIGQLTKVFSALSQLDPKVIEGATNAATFAAKAFLVSKALKGIIALQAGIKATLAATATGLKASGTAAQFANPKLILAKNTLLALSKIGLITVGIDIIVNGLGKLAEVEARLKKFSAPDQGTEGFAKSVGGSALSKQEIKKLLDENAAELKRRQEELASVKFPLLTAQDDIAKAAILQLKTRAAKLESMLSKAQYATAADRANADTQRLLSGLDLDTKKTGGGSAKSSASAALTDDIENLQRIEQLMRELAPLQDEFNEAALKGNQVKQLAAEQEMEMKRLLSENAEALAGMNTEEGKLLQARINALRVAELQTQQLQAQKQLGMDIGEMLGTDAVDLAQNQKKVNDELTEGEKLLNNAYSIVTNNLTSAIKGLVDGTKEWNDVLSDIAGQLGSLLMNAGFKMLGTSLGIPGFADGGRPPVGQVSLIGERGPELFVPDTAGTVINNTDTRAALNRVSSNSNSNITSASEAPSSVPSVLNMSFQTTRFMDKEWVDREQLETAMRVTRQKAVREGAAAGHTKTMTTLKNSGSQRRRIGL